MTDVIHVEISTPLIYFATADSQEFLFVVKLQGVCLDLSWGLVAVRKLTLCLQRALWEAQSRRVENGHRLPTNPGKQRPQCSVAEFFIIIIST